MKRIALDARLTRQMSVGMKTYVRELVERIPAIAPDLDFIVLSNEYLHTQSLTHNLRYEFISDWVAANGGVGEQFFFPRQLERNRVDLVHFMSVYAPRRSSLPHVYTIHDLIHLRFPKYFSWKVPPYYRLVVKPVARTATRVITDAAATIADLECYLGVEAQSVRVVPLAVAEEFYINNDERSRREQAARKRFGLHRPYFLYAGNHRPHKNLATMIAAWQHLSAACDLVITEEGTRDDGFDAGNKTDGQIFLPGHVSKENLIDLYAGCSAVIQPSLYEGFGLSVLEAMASGAPVIVADTAVLREVGAAAAVAFPSADADALAALMTRILGNPQWASKLQAAGRDRARDFSWQATAQKTVAVYREALGV